MSYVIVNNETGKYVTRPGSESSYTNKLQEARPFPTRDAAKAECCGNEHVENIQDIMRQ